MSNTGIASAGNFGEKVRSDCYVELNFNTSNGREIEVKSKVNAYFGKSIRQLIDQFLDFYSISNVQLKLIDTGALPFVLMARLEAAYKSVFPDAPEFLPEFNPANKQVTLKDQFRFSRLYLPGNSPSMMINAAIHKPNGLILDLEDSVALPKKHDARYLVRNALRVVDFLKAEKMVRVNQGQRGIEDLSYIIPHYVNCILLPKCESAESVQAIDAEVNRLLKESSLDYPIYYMPIIESALGVEKAYEIATSSPRVSSLAIGLEDFTADLGVSRTNSATESFYARTRLVNACKAAGIQAIDSVFSDVADSEGLFNTVVESKGLGFEGMGCIHPRQIQIIHKGFSPSEDEISKAKRIMLAWFEAQEKGLGVVSLGSKMIDPPVVKRAERTINLSLQLGIIPENWKETAE